MLRVMVGRRCSIISVVYKVIVFNKGRIDAGSQQSMAIFCGHHLAMPFPGDEAPVLCMVIIE